MEPKMVRKEALIIAGIGGNGNETVKVWETLMKIQRLHPLTNQASEEAFEVRMHPPNGPEKIHIGMLVKDEKVPSVYKTLTIPAADYAEFEIYPAKGYDSTNAAINQWLAENVSEYQEAQLDGQRYVIEIYDNRYKGDKNPDSVVGILVPLVSVGKKPEGRE
jgi:predicted transcriptional regulator YdeE